MIHSSALGYSPRPPVSVYGTGTTHRFSWMKLHWIITATEVLVYYLYITIDSTYYSVSTHQLHFTVTFNSVVVQEY